MASARRGLIDPLWARSPEERAHTLPMPKAYAWAALVELLLLALIVFLAQLSQRPHVEPPPLVVTLVTPPEEKKPAPKKLERVKPELKKLEAKKSAPKQAEPQPRAKQIGRAHV